MTDFDNFSSTKTGMNTLPNVYKLFNPNLTMSLLYMVKSKITKTADCLRSVEPIVSDFRRKLSNVRFLPYLLENSFSSRLTKSFYILMGFYQKLYLQTQYC